MDQQIFDDLMRDATEQASNYHAAMTTYYNAMMYKYDLAAAATEAAMDGFRPEQLNKNMPAYRTLSPVVR